MYLGLEDKVKDLAAYHTNVKSGGYFDKKVKAFVEIDAIEEDTIFLKNGEMRAVLRIIPVNLAMYDEQKKRAVMLGFARFLQQLDHPMQIHARTVNVDLTDYFDANEKRIAEKNPNLLQLFKDFRKYEEDKILGNAVMNRLFYVVIPLVEKDKPKGKRLDLLADRVKIIQEGLTNAGLVSERVGENQLVSLVSSYFEERVFVGSDYLSRRTSLKGYEDQKEWESEEQKGGVPEGGAPRLNLPKRNRNQARLHPGERHLLQDTLRRRISARRGERMA